jgi:pSer/pThr/pTyr-binding forkhead associated (FHA) protein
VGEGAMLGRANGADIKVDDPFASSAHARIFPRGDFMYVEDMGSTNGTYLNGRQLRTAQRLSMADVIRIGDSEYRYQE